MKIAFVSPYITSFSVAKQFYHVQLFGLAEKIASHGNFVVILTSNKIIKNYDVNYSRFRRYVEFVNGFRVIYLPTLLDVAGQPIMPTLSYEIVKVKPDIVQTAEDFQISTLLALLLKLFYSIRVYVHQGTYRYAIRKNLLHRIYIRTLGKLVHKYADHFIAKTNAAKNYLLAQGVIPSKISVIPVGFQKKYFYYVNSTRLHKIVGRQSGKILLNVGRLVLEKNHGSLILALKEILQQFQDIYLVILGDGPEKKNLLALIHKKRLNRNVFIYTKEILNSEMHEVYSDCFLYIIPSTYEPFNMTMLEAMACAKPVIASNEGGMADVIVNAKTGYLLEHNNHKEISKYVCSLLNDKNEYNNLKANAEKLSFQYDWSKLIKSYLKLYTDAFQRK